jgi:hypothetical protein
VHCAFALLRRRLAHTGQAVVTTTTEGVNHES